VTRPESRRQNLRFDVDLPVELRLGERLLLARAKNASIGGLFIEIDDKLPLGQRLHVRFEIGGHVIEGGAVVRWHGDRGAGVQFEGLRARDVYALGKFLETLAG